MVVGQHFLAILTLLAVLCSSYGCTVVDVQFTIGFLDDDSNCVGDASAYPPVFLQYRQHKNDEWIEKWNTSDISTAHRTEELSIPVSSSPPHFTLRWLQNAMPRTPALFISDIALMGSGGPGNKCKLDKVIDFSSDGLDYVQCSSGIVNTYSCNGEGAVGLVFNGTNREMRLCNFNLASGKCIGQDETCVISADLPITATPSSTSFIGLVSSSISTTTSPSDNPVLPSSSNTEQLPVLHTTETVLILPTSTVTDTLLSGMETVATPTPSSGYTCTVAVQFTIGFLDDDSNCVGDASAYPPVFLQYKQHENDQWITEWNTSDTTNTHHTKELSITVSSSPPHFTLRWLQDAMPSTPTLFISDITLKTTGGPGNKCKLDKVIDFASDGLDYVQCSSGIVNTYSCNGESAVGLVFNGTNRKMKLCIFNLASGKCIGQDETCTISADLPITATPSSTSFTGLVPSLISTTSLSSETSDNPVLPSSTIANTEQPTVSHSTGTVVHTVLTSTVTDDVLTLSPSMETQTSDKLVVPSSSSTEQLPVIHSTETIVTSAATMPVSSGTDNMSTTSSIMGITATPSPISSNVCTLTIQFTIGFLDDDSNCVGDVSGYPPVFLQYRQHENDQWITEWNTSDTTNTHHTEELSIPVSSNPPHFTLRWLQDAMPSTPTLFISDITLKTTSGPGNKCKYFASDGLDYVQCSSGIVNTYSCNGGSAVALVFNGRNREMRLCNFNLASGKCIGQDDTCTISANSPITVTPSSTSFTGLASSSISTTSMSSTVSDNPVLPSSSSIDTEQPTVSHSTGTVVHTTMLTSTVTDDITTLSPSMETRASDNPIVPSSSVDNTKQTTALHSTEIIMKIPASAVIDNMSTTLGIMATPSPSTSNMCTVTVQFTIGFLDDDSNCVGDASAYPPVFLQYRQHENDQWITEWNTSEIKSAHHTEELSITISSSPPHFALRWLQDTMPSPPTLFISNITLKTTGGPGNKCKLDKAIDFASDGLDYVQCSSGIVNTYSCNGESAVGLVFNGTNREMRLCIFNLASGKCIGQDDTCTISADPPVTATPSSISFIELVSSSISTTSLSIVTSNNPLLPSLINTEQPTVSHSTGTVVHMTMLTSTMTDDTMTLSPSMETTTSDNSIIPSSSVEQPTVSHSTETVVHTTILTSTMTDDISTLSPSMETPTSDKPVVPSSSSTEQLPVIHSTETIVTSAATMPVSSVTDNMSTASSSMGITATPSPISSNMCTVTVQFTIGFLDDDSNCVGDVSAYPPVFLQYRQHENDQWITQWNTSDTTNTHHTEELSIPVSSSPPYFTLRWLQDAIPSTPTLFISDIILKTTGGPGNKCKLDKVIDFASDGLDYVQCSSGIVNAYSCNGGSGAGLVFSGKNREMRLCIFSLASGKCIEQDDTCIIRADPSVTATPSSTSFIGLVSSSIATSLSSATSDNPLIPSSINTEQPTVSHSTGTVVHTTMLTSTVTDDILTLSPSIATPTSDNPIISSSVDITEQPTMSHSTETVVHTTVLTSTMTDDLTTLSSSMETPTSDKPVVPSSSSTEQLPVIHSTETIITSAATMPVSSGTDNMSTTSSSMGITATPSPISSSMCTVTVQFSIGFLDDDSNCVGDVSAYPPVFLQYRQHENDQWITQWNTSDTTNTHHTEELSIPVSSSPPHFTLRWLQDAMPSTPTLFISDITLKTTGGPGNKCKLDKAIDFASDGLDYVQCSSGIVNIYSCNGGSGAGLVFNGTNREMRLCIFNLASGKCIGQDDTCIISANPSVTATPSSTSFIGLVSSSISTTSLSSATSNNPVLPSSINTEQPTVSHSTVTVVHTTMLTSTMTDDKMTLSPSMETPTSDKPVVPSSSSTEQSPVIHSTESIVTSAATMPVSSVTDNMSTTSSSMGITATPSPISSSMCTVTIQFTIGFLDDDSNCVGDASAYSPVFLQYRQHENDQWITQWNTSDTTNTHRTEELSITVSSSPPHFTLRWLQDAMPSTPTLFISDITLKTTGGPGNKCKLDKVIDFDSDGLDYVQCSSGIVNIYSCNGGSAVGLVFNGTNREMRLCNFNLASGKCIGQDDTCTISADLPVTVTPSSTSFIKLVSSSISTTSLSSATSDNPLLPSSINTEQPTMSHSTETVVHTTMLTSTMIDDISTLSPSMETPTSDNPIIPSSSVDITEQPTVPHFTETVVHTTMLTSTMTDDIPTLSPSMETPTSDNPIIPSYSSTEQLPMIHSTETIVTSAATMPVSSGTDNMSTTSSSMGITATPSPISSSMCTVTVQFTIGFLDDNDNCIGDASAYSPVFLQYRQHENDQWITEWNTSDTTNAHHTEELSIPVSSSPPHFTLRWLQDAMPSTPTLFISDITLKITGGPGNKCKLDKAIDFASDGLDYVQCSSGIVNTYNCNGGRGVGLVFNGTNREMRLCIFNLASGNCIGQHDTCIISADLPVTVTPLSTSFTGLVSPSISTTSLSSTTTSDIIPSPVISVTVSSAITGQLTVLSSITDEVSRTTKSVSFMSSRKIQSSLPILHSTTLMTSPTPSIRHNCNTVDVQFTIGYLNDNTSCIENSDSYPPVIIQYRQQLNNNEWITKNATSITDDTDEMISVSVTLQPSLSHMQLRLLQIVDRSIPAMFISNITLNNCDDDITKFDSNWLKYIQCSSGIVTTYTCSGSHEVGLILNGLNREVILCNFNLSSEECVNDDNLCTLHNELSITPTKLETTTASISYGSEASNIGMQTTSESFSTLYPSSSPTRNFLDYCKEETTNETSRDAQLSNTTRILYCSDKKEFAIQVCRSSAPSQPKWYPHLTFPCNETGLPISEDIYNIFPTLFYGSVAEFNNMICSSQIPCDNEINENDKIEIIKTYLEEPDINISPGDPVLISELLLPCNISSERLCTQENIKNFITIIDTLMESRFINVLKDLGKKSQDRFITNLFYSTDDFVLNCLDPKHPPPQTNHTGLSAVDVEWSHIPEALNLSTDTNRQVYGSFILPKKLIGIARNEGLQKLRIASYSFQNLNELLARPIYSNGEARNTFYQLLSPVNSKLISCNTTKCKQALKAGVEIVINHLEPTSSGICAFYNFSLAMEYDPFWSTDGCTVIKTNRNLTVCRCNHLTHFAVLSNTNVLSLQVTATENQCSQPFIFYLCIGISMVVLLLAIAFLILFRSLWGLATFVHINLCITLFIICLLLIFICANSVPGGCMTVAILLQYFYLASFMWMLMEGVVLYIVLIKIWTQIHWKYYFGLSLLCYGSPLLYMALSIPLGLLKQKLSFEDGDMCFLGIYDKFIWIIIVPVIFIILLMVLLLIYLFKMREKLEEKHDIHLNSMETILHCYKRWLQGVTILAIVMTVVWIITMIYCYKHSLPMTYAFGGALVVQSIAVFLLSTICFRKVYKIWKGIFLMFKERQGKMDIGVPKHLTIDNTKYFNDRSEETQMISYSPTSLKEFVMENSSDFQPNSYTLREIFIISDCTVESNSNIIQHTDISTKL